MRPLERPKVFEEGGPRAENVLEDGLRPAQSLDLMRTGLRPLVVSLPTYQLPRIGDFLRVTNVLSSRRRCPQGARSPPSLRALGPRGCPRPYP